MSAATRYVEHFRDLEQTLPGMDLPWLNRLREEARDRFADRGFPTPREEEWRYTNVAPIEKKLFRPATGTPALPADSSLLEAVRLADAWSLVFVDGRYAPDLSVTEGLPASVRVGSMVEALRLYPEEVHEQFQHVAGREDHGFIALSTAYFGDGAYVGVPAGAALSKPVQIIHYANAPESLAVLRNLIHLKANAEAQVVETYIGVDGGSYLTAAVTEIVLDENAGLDHYKLQTESARAYHFGGIYAEQARTSRLRQHHLAFGGLLARTEVHAELGQGADCDLDGLFLASGARHLDTHTLIHHSAPHGTSRETYRGIASERGKGVFSGRIVVHAQAQKTNAEMSNRNLLLSENAEIDSKPQLEIHADDVRCSHGVTTGQLDPNALFFLASRGLDEASARNMLTFGFANEIVERIRLDSFKSLAQAELLKALPQSDIRGEWL